MSHPRSCLYVGKVMHHRLRPVAHRFTYGVFSLFLDLDELPHLKQHLRLLGIERRGLLGFRNRDHGPRDGSQLRPWVLAELARHGVPLGQETRVRLLCFPRLLGYVFNPLSIYFCYREACLVAVLYEVKNTFGGQHTYGFALGPGALARHGCRKAFYVSPFIEMAARYEFSLRAPDTRLAVAIREHDAEGCFLVATQRGERRPLTDRALLVALARNLLMTFKVIAGIHLEALRLWLKGAPYVPRVPPDDLPVRAEQP